MGFTVEVCENKCIRTYELWDYIEIKRRFKSEHGRLIEGVDREFVSERWWDVRFQWSVDNWKSKDVYEDGFTLLWCNSIFHKLKISRIQIDKLEELREIRLFLFHRLVARTIKIS